MRPGSDHHGELQAWDPATGKKAWQHNFRWQLMATVLATGGDLVFVGGTNDRMFRAFDAKTGDVLWEQKTNSGVTGAPVAYECASSPFSSVGCQSGKAARHPRSMGWRPAARKAKPRTSSVAVVWR